MTSKSQPIFNFGKITKIFLLVYSIIFAVTVFLFPYPEIIWRDYGFIPALAWQRPWTFFTYQFLHGSFMHLIINCAMFAALGTGMERLLTPGRFILFVLLCGMLAPLGEWLLDPHSPIMLIGASGAVTALLGAFMRMQSRKNNWKGLFTGPVIGVAIALAAGAFLSIPLNSAPISWISHITGLIAGFLLWPVFKPLPAKA